MKFLKERKDTIVILPFHNSFLIKIIAFSLLYLSSVTLTQPTVNDCVNVEVFTLQDRMPVQFMEPTAADGCGSVLLFSATARSGDFFPVGQTAVTFSFSDSCGNIAVCNFVVTVNNGKYIFKMLL